MTPVLKSDFFNQPTLTVAKELLGCRLARRLPDGRIRRLAITEVEAYDGFRDKASHAHRGRTERNAPMFGPAGYWYVYLVYGMHWMLNVVTGPVDYPAAVLIRGVEEINGPARLTKVLAIDRSLDACRASRQNGLWLEARPPDQAAPRYRRLPRIGVDYAGDWADKPYRFQKVLSSG